MISYSYSAPSSPPLHPPSYKESQEGVTIKVQCPTLSSCHWCLKLYGLVVGGMGIIFSFLWIIVHLYVLSQIGDDNDLRIQRYMDICLGLSLLVSLVSLEYGSMTGERAPLALFLILSLATLASYWLWFLYLNAFFYDELKMVPLYLLLVLPVSVLYDRLGPALPQITPPAESEVATKPKKMLKKKTEKVKPLPPALKNGKWKISARPSQALNGPVNGPSALPAPVGRPDPKVTDTLFGKLSWVSTRLPSAPPVSRPFPAASAEVTKVSGKFPGVARTMAVVSQKWTKVADKMTTPKRPAKLFWISSTSPGRLPVEGNSVQNTDGATKKKSWPKRKLASVLKKIPGFPGKYARALSKV